MNRYFGLALLSGACLLGPMGPGSLRDAAAQENITPIPTPATGATPPAPSGAQETYDEVSVGQLMKIVELSRLVAGGVSQLFGSAQGQKQLLDAIRGAQTGPKDIPLLNGPDEVAGREGGQGLKEMAEGALNGATEGPPDLVDALNQFRATYDLDKAFALKDDELPGKKMLAQLGAKGAIAASTAENSYKRANASMDRLNEYIKALESSTDLKTSIDLNTRAMIELTQQSNESLRTQSAITSIVSTYFMVLASESSEKDWVDGLKEFNR